MTSGPDTQPARRSWLTAMPKAELHLHLDGSLRPATALELAIERNVLVDGRVPDLAVMEDRLVAPPHCADQVELLRAFDLPVSLLQDATALERAGAELVEDVASDGTQHVEIRWAPSLHLERGLGLDEGIAAVARGTQVAGARLHVSVGLIAVALRTHPPEMAVRVAEAAVRAMAEGVVGLDLAGREAEAPDPRAFEEAFAVARSGGLGITCHAGEWGGAEQVRAALAIGPWRIAHGAPAAEDPDLLDTLRDRGVTLDLCPTSSVQAGIVADVASHPVARLLRSGVRVTISTDDRTVSQLSLVDELERTMVDAGLEPSEILTAQRNAIAAAFLHHDEPKRARLLADLEAWAALSPAPRGDQVR